MGMLARIGSAIVSALNSALQLALRAIATVVDLPFALFDAFIERITRGGRAGQAAEAAQMVEQTADTAEAANAAKANVRREAENNDIEDRLAKTLYRYCRAVVAKQEGHTSREPAVPQVLARLIPQLTPDEIREVSRDRGSAKMMLHALAGRIGRGEEYDVAPAAAVVATPIPRPTPVKERRRERHEDEEPAPSYGMRAA